MATVLETIRVTTLPDGGRHIRINRGTDEVFVTQLDRTGAAHLSALLNPQEKVA